MHLGPRIALPKEPNLGVVFWGSHARNCAVSILLWAVDYLNPTWMSYMTMKFERQWPLGAISVRSRQRKGSEMKHWVACPPPPLLAKINFFNSSKFDEKFCLSWGEGFLARFCNGYGNQIALYLQGVTAKNPLVCEGWPTHA